jgi:hypothetical protein
MPFAEKTQLSGTQKGRIEPIEAYAEGSWRVFGRTAMDPFAISDARQRNGIPDVFPCRI